MPSDPLLSLQRVIADLSRNVGGAELHLDEVRPRLERLLRHLDEEMGLDAAGKRAAYETLLDFLQSRAGLLNDQLTYPGLAESPVERPIFVTGLPRSGTTLLHSLLAADPNNRAPIWWEGLRPSPPPGLAGADDPRRARADRDIEDFVNLNRNILKSHPYFDQGGNTIIECEPLAVTDLRTVLRAAYFRVPGVVRINLNDDAVAMYTYHRKVLQSLQWARPKRRWALKGTEHHTRLPALKTVYPDGAVIWLHRDPQKVFPSVMEMLTSVAEGVAGAGIDRPAFGREIMRKYAAMLQTAMASPLIDHPDVYHMRYGDFIRDPASAIGDAYERLGLPFGDAQVSAIGSWMSAPQNKGDRHGRFTYDLASFEVTPEALEDVVRPYRERFEIPFE